MAWEGQDPECGARGKGGGRAAEGAHPHDHTVRPAAVVTKHSSMCSWLVGPGWGREWGSHTTSATRGGARRRPPRSVQPPRVCGGYPVPLGGRGGGRRDRGLASALQAEPGSGARGAGRAQGGGRRARPASASERRARPRGPGRWESRRPEPSPRRGPCAGDSARRPGGGRERASERRAEGSCWRPRGRAR